MDQKLGLNTIRNGKTKLTREELLAGKCFPDELQKEIEENKDPRIKSPDDFLQYLLKSRNGEQGQTPVQQEPQFSNQSDQNSPISDEKPVLISNNGQALSHDPFSFRDEELTKPEIEIDIFRPSMQMNKATIEYKEVKNPSPEKTIPIPTEKNSTKPPISDASNIENSEEMILYKPPKLEEIQQLNVALELEELRHLHERKMKQWQEYNQQIELWKTQVLSTIASVKEDLSEVQSLRDKVKLLKKELDLKNEEIEQLQKNINKTSPKPDFLMKLLGKNV